MSIMDMIEKADKHQLHLYAGPGRWNDPDMLEVGNGKLKYDENVAHFSMWAMMAAPLLAGNDLRNMPEEVLRILTNKKVISVNQDVLGKQGYKISETKGVQIWVKPLSEGRWAVCFLNPGGRKTIQVDWSVLRLDDIYVAEDVWKGVQIKTGVATQMEIPKHGVRMWLLKKL
jgi:alpha-galactosidase